MWRNLPNCATSLTHRHNFAHTSRNTLSGSPSKLPRRERRFVPNLRNGYDETGEKNSLFLAEISTY